jgi:hypothetical protein
MNFTLVQNKTFNRRECMTSMISTSLAVILANAGIQQMLHTYESRSVKTVGLKAIALKTLRVF